MECIILAGGLGTRLRGVIGDMPKCMAPVGGKPFLHYLLQYLANQQADRIICSLGYQHSAVTGWISGQQYPFEIVTVIEHEALGTGGGIGLAMSHCREQQIFVVNGDTLFLVNLHEMLETHNNRNAETTLALKAMKHFDRYGTVCTNGEGLITSFEEKAPRQQGDINGGVYLIDRDAMNRREMPEKFSFEKDYLERYVTEQRFYGYHSDSYFIDIGVPQDYDKAQQDFPSLFPRP